MSVSHGGITSPSAASRVSYQLMTSKGHFLCTHLFSVYARLSLFILYLSTRSVAQNIQCRIAEKSVNDESEKDEEENGRGQF